MAVARLAAPAPLRGRGRADRRHYRDHRKLVWDGTGTTVTEDFTES